MLRVKKSPEMRVRENGEEVFDGIHTISDSLPRLNEVQGSGTYHELRIKRCA
jgi:hypothetical protein